jgi:hypothetical protein
LSSLAYRHSSAVEQQQRRDNRDEESGARALPVDRAPVLADREGEAEQGDNAERGLQMVHVTFPPHGGG